MSVNALSDWLSGQSRELVLLHNEIAADPFGPSRFSCARTKSRRHSLYGISDPLRNVGRLSNHQDRNVRGIGLFSVHYNASPRLAYWRVACMLIRALTDAGLDTSFAILARQRCSSRPGEIQFVN